MPPITLYTRQAAIRKATLIITSLALSKLRLFNPTLTLTEFTTASELIAAEANFSSYPTGGYVLTAWVGPAYGSAGGAVITSPTVFISNDQDPEDPLPSQVGGWWVDDASGNPRIAGTFDPVKEFTSPWNSFPWITQIIEALNIAQG